MPAALPAELSALRELVGTLKEALELSRQENLLLRQKIDALVRRVFGASSERLDRAQLELLLQLPALTETNPVVAVIEIPKVAVSRFRKDRTPRLPDNLPVVEAVIEPEPVKAAPQSWRCIGEEVSEQLDYEPARFLRRRTIRKKYVHRTEPDLAPVIAPLPECLQERGLAAPGLLAQVLVSKYCDHLPRYRQEQIFLRRHQVHLPRQTLARWVRLAADWLQPICEQIRTGVMAGGYVQVDETPVNYLEPGHGQTKQGYFWTGSRPKGDVFFRWETSRATACLDRVVPLNFTGTLQSDGYAAYRAFANSRGETIILAGCWAHVRRKFYDALESSPQLAGPANPAPLPSRIRFAGTTRRPNIARRRARPSKPPPRRPPEARAGETQNRRTASAPKARWPEPSNMPSASGARWKFIWPMVAWRSTTTSWRMPFAPRPLAKRTGSSSATPRPVNAARSSTRSSKAAVGAVSTLTLT